MSAKEKQRFEEMAEKDKGRYDREMANYDKTGGGGGGGKGARGGKRKKTKDPNAPKRALLVHLHRSFLHFVITLRVSFLAALCSSVHAVTEKRPSRNWCNLIETCVVVPVEVFRFW